MLYESAPSRRDRFIKDWDSQKYANAVKVLRDSWQEGKNVTQIDADKLLSVRRYGVFAIPFIIERIEKDNSPELFAAFLSITDNWDLYAQFSEDFSKVASRDQKLLHMKSWASKNEQKMDKLKGLHERVKALAASKP
jgi:hypothetical protein